MFLAASAFAQSPFTAGAVVGKVAAGFQFTEGPCLRPDGVLLFSDIPADTVYQWTAEDGAQPYYKPSGNSNGLALDGQGRLLLAQHGKRRVARWEADGTETPLATQYGGKRLNSPNDLVVKSDGRIYFTDPPYGISSSEEELGFYGVYRVTSDPQAPELLVKDLRRPNGIAFSPDESRLYVADTDDARVMVFDVKADGTLANERVFVQNKNDLAPDGVKVDATGNLYVAGSDGKIWIYSPAGERLGSIAVPEKTRNLAWGDSGRRSLYVTSGASVYRVLPAMTTMSRLAGTGQTGKFTATFGQDSDYALNPPKFAVNGDGTVTDLITGLIWQQTDGPEMTIENAGPYCKSLSLGGYQDWRLPFAHEAYTILNHSAVNPALDTTVFTKTAAEYWWTGDSRADDPTRIWVTNAGGGIGPHPKNETISAGGAKRMQVRCVRSSISIAAIRASLTDNGDGTITDNHTGLMWQKADSGNTLTWEAALRYAEGLSLAGYDDWRLPNIKELQSISDEHLVNPSLDKAYFTGAIPAENWSSTTLANQPGSAWTIDFTLGIGSYRAKTDTLRARAVRGGFAALSIVSAASFASDPILAPGSLASAFGNLAPLSILGGAAFTLTDAAGFSFNLPILAAASSQVNVVVPDRAQTGIASAALSSNGRQIAAGVLRLDRVAPGLFSANADGKGVAAAVALTVAADGRQTSQVIFDQSAPAGLRRAVSIDLTRAGDQVYLLLFGVGMRSASQKAATVGGISVPVAGPAPQGEFDGLDQVNLGPLPISLAGRADAEIVVSMDGKQANKVTANFK